MVARKSGGSVTPSPAPAKPRCASARPGRRTSASAFVGDPPAPDDPLLGFAPYIHVAPRRNSITPDRQVAFIAALAATGIVTQAARTIGASLEALYMLRNRPGAEGFALAWEGALDRGLARLEDCALERAIAGEERPVVRGGEVVTIWRRYDTQLITFLLRHRRGDRFSADRRAKLRPGQAEYERLKREWVMQSAEDAEAIYASIDAKLDLMVARAEAAAEGEADGEDAEPDVD